MHTNPHFSVAETFRSIQGEGKDAGRPALFVRLAGCNLSCEFCDTDHKQTGFLDGASLIEIIVKAAENTKLVVFTGGEPLLQPIDQIIPQLKSFGFEIGVETNGTIETDTEIFNSLSLSPKVPREECRIQRCHSLKILYPYLDGVHPEDYESMYATYKFIQPIWKDGDDAYNQAVMKATAAEVMRLGKGWRLGLQIHKFVGME